MDKNDGAGLRAWLVESRDYWEEEAKRLERELAVTDSLLVERQRVLDAIPECPVHGPCVPHALEWITKNRSRVPRCLSAKRARHSRAKRPKTPMSEHP